MTNMLWCGQCRVKQLTILCLCVNHIKIKHLTKQLDIDNSLGNPTYTPTNVMKEEILEIIGMCCVPLLTNVR